MWRAQPDQTCAAIKMLNHLHEIGFRFKQVTNRNVDVDAPRVGSWATSAGPWATLPSFPSSNGWKRPASASSGMRALFGRRGGAQNGSAPMTFAYRTDFRSFSTNLIALRDDAWRCTGALGRCPAWPTLVCK